MSDTNVLANVFTNQLLDPKSSVGIYDLPCGYIDRQGVLHTEIQVREMTGNEEDLLAAKKIKAAKKMNAVMAACVERIGTITDKAEITKAIPEMLLGDRVFILFAIRRVSFGDVYVVNEICPACERTGTYPVDLNLLETKKMPDVMKRTFTEVLPSGRTVKFHLPTGLDEMRVADMATGMDDLSITMLMRVETIEDRRATLEGLKALPSKDRNVLRSLFDTHEGGVDTGVDYDCSACGATFKRDLSLDAGFFFPSQIQKS